MKKYDLAVLLHPDLEIDLEASLKRLDDILAELKAAIKQRDEWGKRKLAYKIAKQNYAIYVFYQLECDPAKVARLDTLLGLNDEVLRYLITQPEPPETDAKATKDKDKASPKPTASKLGGEKKKASPAKAAPSNDG